MNGRITRTMKSSLTKFLSRFRRSSGFRKRFDVINFFADGRNLRRYLEIGTRTGACLAQVHASSKTGVDPAPRAFDDRWKIHVATSDDFFRTNRERFNLVFIDGLHLATQVVRDIYNSLRVLDAPGVILLHDCNPATEAAQRQNFSRDSGNIWNGDVWKALAFVREREPDLFTCTVDVDHGIGVIVPKRYDLRWEVTADLEATAAAYFAQHDYRHLDADRAGLIGLVPSREALEAALESIQEASSRSEVAG